MPNPFQALIDWLRPEVRPSVQPLTPALRGQATGLDFGRSVGAYGGATGAGEVTANYYDEMALVRAAMDFIGLSEYQRPPIMSEPSRHWRNAAVPGKGEAYWPVFSGPGSTASMYLRPGTDPQTVYHELTHARDMSQQGYSREQTGIRARVTDEYSSAKQAYESLLMALQSDGVVRPHKPYPYGLASESEWVAQNGAEMLMQILQPSAISTDPLADAERAAPISDTNKYLRMLFGLGED